MDKRRQVADWIAGAEVDTILIARFLLAAAVILPGPTADCISRG
jgi:hypothetical protein